MSSALRPQPSTAVPNEMEVRNRVLAGLLTAEFKHILPKLERVTLTAGQALYRADQKIEVVYFPEDAVVAMIDRMQDGGTVEVGIIGREGFVGINVFLGGAVTPDEAIVQIPGGAMRMSADALREETHFGSPLQQVLLGYARTFLAVISQSVACSQHHDIEQRLARLLLTLNAYTGSREIPLGQSSVAALLGVRRAGVSVAAGNLQAQGVLRCRRGTIKVIDRRTLEKKSCECRRFIQSQYAQFQRAVRSVSKQGARDRSTLGARKKPRRVRGDFDRRRS
jgi:CRP-like cAMP-binding protein